MKERPILFSAPMVRALLAGTKTQTRRVYKARNGGIWPNHNDLPGMRQILRNSPHGQPGDRLWVRETWGYIDPDNSGYEIETGPGAHFAPELMQEGHALRDFWRRRVAYRATWKEPTYGVGPDAPGRWRSSIHMPRWASRILLEITSVRVERLQDINEADAKAEGVELSYDRDRMRGGTWKGGYRMLWESINGPGSWDANPWVWVLEFKRVEGGAQ